MPSLKQIQAIFFDLGGTLVDPKFTPAGAFDGFVVLPDTVQGLAALKGKFRLGVISNTGDIPPQKVRQALTDLGLLAEFEAGLVLLSGEVHMEKSTPAIFRAAVQAAGVPATVCLYVGDAGDERRNARRAGMSTRSSMARAVADLKAKPGAGDTPNLSQLPACVTDSRDAGLDSSPGPAEPDDFAILLTRLDASAAHLPPSYRNQFALPFATTMRQLGAAGFAKVLARDPRREGLASLLMDCAQAVLQNGEGFESLATDAFQEVVADLYDGFLSAETRSGLKMPDNSVLPPLVKWGNPDSGPYTWPIDATRRFQCEAAVVNLPPANAHAGLFAWAALGHETAGHDIMAADDGLGAEISQKLRVALAADPLAASLADYWATRIDETASDVMGILNMGPAAGIGLVVYFRGLDAAFGGAGKLRNAGPGDDPHPADILRGFLAAATVRLLSFDGAAAWGQAIEAETMKDLSQITVNGVPVSLERVRRSCDIVAHTIAAVRLDALNGHAMIEIQNWRNTDEAVVQELQRSLVAVTPVSSSRASGVFAAHVVAGACMAALSGAGSVPNIFKRMLAVLKAMHDANPAWGPLFIMHAGTVVRDLTYQRH